jgi:hypothetical protein
VSHEKVTVGGVDTQESVKPYIERFWGGADHLSVYTQCQPFGVSHGGAVIPLHRNVDRHTDIACMTGFDLLFEQVSIHQAWVNKLRIAG